MSVQGAIEQEYKQAFKANDRAVVSALRMLKSSIKNREIDVGRELTDEETIDVIRREVKRRREALAQYERGGRSDLARHEQDDITVYTRYLPQQMSEQELERVVRETIGQGQASPADFGKIMGAVMAKVKGRADGAVVQAVVRRIMGS